MTTRELKALSFKKRNGMGSEVISIYTFLDFTKLKHALSKQYGYFNIHAWLYFRGVGGVLDMNKFSSVFPEAPNLPVVISPCNRMYLCAHTLKLSHRVS